MCQVVFSCQGTVTKGRCEETARVCVCTCVPALESFPNLALRKTHSSVCGFPHFDHCDTSVLLDSLAPSIASFSFPLIRSFTGLD